jgi:riboflavin transporter FmnP
MVGEICRELAVLVLVFVPLELYKNTETSHAVVVGAIMGSIVLAALGILIEWLRK